MIRARILAIVVAWVVGRDAGDIGSTDARSVCLRSVPIPGVSTGHEPDRGHPTGRYHR